MNLISVLLDDLERSSAGSEKTATQVISMSGIKGSVLYVGDEVTTPLLLINAGCNVTAAITEESRLKAAKAAGLDAVYTQLFELPKKEGGYDGVWYNGSVEFDGIPQRAEQLKAAVAKGGTVIYRTLCWLTEPSPEAKTFVQKRFGIVQPIDKVIISIKESGFRIQDFYIAPKSDWTEGFYRPLMCAAQEYAGVHPQDTTVTTGMSELKKEISVFEEHCEEYSYVYYILKG